MHWTTIVIKGIRRGVTARQVEKATGYRDGTCDIRDGSAWIEVANDGRKDERLAKAAAACEAAGLMEATECQVSK